MHISKIHSCCVGRCARRRHRYTPDRKAKPALSRCFLPFTPLSNHRGDTAVQPVQPGEREREPGVPTTVDVAAADVHQHKTKHAIYYFHKLTKWLALLYVQYIFWLLHCTP